MAHAEEAARELDRLASTQGGLDDTFRAAVWAMTSAAVALQLARESLEREGASQAR